MQREPKALCENHSVLNSAQSSGQSVSSDSQSLRGSEHVPRRNWMSPPQSWCSQGAANVFTSVGDWQTEDQPREVLKPMESPPSQAVATRSRGKENADSSARAASDVGPRRRQAASSPKPKAIAASASTTPEGKFAALRQKEAEEDRKRVRARAAGRAFPEQQGVISARQRLSTSCKRWAGESPNGESTGRLMRTRSELFRRRDARIRRFLERGLRWETVAEVDAPGGDALKRVPFQGGASIDLTAMEVEAEALSEEWCQPLPPPEPCPLPEPAL